MLALAVAATSAVLAAAPASATLINRGAVDITTGFPAFYTDSTGLSLQPCLDGLPNCPGATADLLSLGADGEGFYYLASSTAGPFDLTLAHEAAYFDVGLNQETVFQRTEVSQTAVPLQHNTNYVITDPYGTFNCPTDASGFIGKNPKTGCRIQTGGAGPLDFDVSLGGRIGPFLTWDTFGSPAGAPPAGYIGDGSTPHLVKGSPSGFNTFRVEGPGANTTPTIDLCPTLAGPKDLADCVESSDFVVSGKVIAGPSATLTPSSLSFSTSPGQTQLASATYNSNGTVAANVASVVLGGAQSQDFTVDSNCVGAVDPGANCSVSATYHPVSSGTSSATVTIVDDTPAKTRVINLTGSSLGVLTVAQTAVDFGAVKVGLVTPRTVAVTNTGVASLSVASPKVSGAYTAETSACGSSLAAGASCNVVVSARPTTAGPQPGSLTLSSGSDSKILTLSANGVTGASSAAPISVSFPATQVGSTTAGSPVTVSNSGPVPMTVGTSVISGSDAGQFVLHQGTCANTAVQPGSSCVLVVQFAPSRPGVTVASLLVPGEGGNLSVPLSGTGIAATPRPVTPRPVTPRPAQVDTIRPVVRQHSPAARATQVRRKAVVTLTFSEAVGGATGHTVALFSAATGKRVAAFVSYNRRTHVVTLVPLTRMGAHSRYRLVLTGGIKDLSGNSLTPSTWSFSTRG
jgi:Bacterial Ig-like domain